MKTLKHFWALVSGSPNEVGESDITARKLQGMLRNCPVCGGDFKGHSYGVFAMAVAEKGNPRLRALLELIETKRWDVAQTFQDFDPSANNVIVYLLQCAKLDRITVLIIRSTAELWESDTLESGEVLLPEESAKLSSMIDGGRFESSLMQNRCTTDMELVDGCYDIRDD
jgi:hypothetical protein